MAFRNLLLKYQQFFDYNLPVILGSTTFSGSVAGGAIAYYEVDKAVREKNAWDYGKIGLSAATGSIAGVIVGVLLEPIIIPCAVVGGIVSGVAKTYDMVKGR